MAISRGSIRHTLGMDMLNVLRSVVQRSRLARRATNEERKTLSRKISQELGFDHVVLFPYARTALYAILKSLELPENSEILLTPITIGPMLEVILALGHKPVFVDIELETFCVDTVDLEAKLTRKPACFLMTYLFGYVPDIERISELCARAATPLIEDISHNIGGTFKGKPLGSFGIASVYSASLLKYVDGYNGAFATTQDSTLAVRLGREVSRFSAPDAGRIARIIRTTFVWNICLSKAPFTMIVYPLLWLIKKLNRKKFERILGARIAFRPSDQLPNYYFEDIASIQCETISRQLDDLGKLIEARRKAAYLAAEAGFKVFGGPILQRQLGNRGTGGETHTFWQFAIPVDDLDGARDALFNHGVETGATNLMNLADEVAVSLPGARALKHKHIFIPVHDRLDYSDYERMFEILRPHAPHG